MNTYSTKRKSNVSHGFLHQNEQLNGLPTLTVETKFNQGYRTALAVNGGGEVVCVRNRNGDVELFTLGTDGTIMNFYPDSTSDTGYSSVSTQMKATTFSAGLDNSGNIVVFGSIGLQLNYISEVNNAGSRWSAPVIVPFPLPINPIAISRIYTEQIGAHLYVAVLTSYRGTVQPSYALSYSNWDTNAPSFQSTPVVFNSLNCMWMGNNDATAGFACVSTNIAIYTVSTSQTKVLPMSSTFTSIDVDTILDQSGNNQIFAILGDGNVNVLAQGGTGQPYYWIPLSLGMNFRQVRTDKDSAGNINVFGVSGDNQLYHWESAQSQSGYSSPPASIQSSVALMGVCANDNGDIDLFTIGTAQNNLNHIFQEELTGNWTVEKVEVPTAGALEQYVSYSTDIAAVDLAGAPLVNSPVVIYTAEETRISINGATWFCGPNKPIRTSTNSAGVLSISQEADALAIPGLEVNYTNVMPAGQTISIAQSAGVQDKLSIVSGTDLMNATDQDGNYIIGSDYRNATTTDSMASAINQCMKVTGAPPNATLLEMRSGTKPGVWLRTGGHPTDLLRASPLQEEQHWQLTFNHGEIVYRELTATEAQRIVAQKNATIQSANGFFDWLDDIGDFVTGVVDGIVDVVDYVVSTVGNAIQAAITFIVDGVTYIFNAAVNFVEQALDMVETIFAYAKAFFEKIWEWIGFLFAWKDILRTHEAIAYTIIQMLAFVQGSITGTQTIVDNGFNNFQAQIQSVFQYAITNIAGTATIGGYASSNQPSQVPTAFDSSTSNNVVYNGVVNNSGSISIQSFATKEALGSISDLLNQLLNFGTDTEAGQAFANAVTYFNNLGQNPDQIFQQLLAGLLSVAEGVALAAVSGVKVLVDAIFQLGETLVGVLQTLLNESWDIPVISQLYSFVTGGSDLTTLDLIALIAAIPVTFTYKIIYNSSPFPDGDSLSAFKNAFSAQTMLQAAGFGSTTRSQSQMAAPTDGGLMPEYATFFAVTGSLATFFCGWFTAVNDAFPTEAPPILSKVVWVLESCAQVCAFPWWASSGSPSCEPSNPDGCARTLWIYQNVGVLMDAVFIGAEGRLPENYNDAGIVVQFVYAIIHLDIAIVASEGTSGLPVANNILPTIPELGKLLRLSSVVEATEGISLGVIAAADALIYTASSIIGFCTATQSTGITHRQPKLALATA
jgi:hypothetical protein